MPLTLSSNTARFFLRISFAMLLVFAIGVFLKFQSVWLMLLATFFVMLTLTGSSVYQGILRFIFLVAAITILAYAYSFSLEDFRHDFISVLVGSLIGVTTNVLFLPERIDIKFQEDVTPFLKISSEYFHSIIKLLLYRDFEEAYLEKQNLEAKFHDLPVWVFERGFDITMKEGHTFYFKKLVDVADILFAMHYIARFEFDKQVLQKIGPDLSRCSEISSSWVDSIATLISQHKPKEGVVDFCEDIDKIANILNDELADDINLEKENSLRLLEFLDLMRQYRSSLLLLAKALR